jgi:hypothetical protein
MASKESMPPSQERKRVKVAELKRRNPVLIKRLQL